MGKTYTIQRGDTIIQLAHQNGFRAWEPIWMHANNTALRSQRLNPHVIAPGDKLYIPDKELQDYQCQTNLKHTFRVRSLTQRLQQTLLDADQNPMAGLKYQLTAGGKVFSKSTDDAGRLIEEIPIHAKTAELKVTLADGDSLTWNIDLGQLEPVNTTFGLKGRLNNLGYDCGPVDDQFDEKTKSALMDYQRDHELEVTGKNDAATQATLLEFHDHQLES
jgi:peptidoglycan hydrolase-like protein with peptidoglycan-binding domain